MRTTPLQRRTELKRTGLSNLRSGPPPRKRGISPASPAQRRKVMENPICVVCGADRYEARVDPMHLVSRALGGCDDPRCVVAGCASCHRAYDDGVLDITPYLVSRYVEEVQHALAHTNGSLTRILRHLSGRVWEPREERAA